MSAFDTNAPTGDPENYLDHLVGEDKKFTDTEALARGKYEADKHVGNLERQLAELKEDMQEAGKIDELMELVRNQQQQNKAIDDPPKEGPGDTSSGQLTTEELKALIETHVTERDKQSTEVRNLTEVDRALADKFGDNAGQVLSNRATVVDMTVDEMKELASRNPKAFYRLMGMDSDSRKVESGNMMGGGQRSEGEQIKRGGSRDFAYYQEMRRDKKTKHLYYSPKIQQQMANDAEVMGAAFYSNS